MGSALNVATPGRGGSAGRLRGGTAMLRCALIPLLLAATACDLCAHGAQSVPLSAWEGERIHELIPGGNRDRSLLVWSRTGDKLPQWVAAIADGQVTARRGLTADQRLFGARLATLSSGYLLVGTTPLGPDEAIHGVDAIAGLRLDAGGAPIGGRFQISEGRAMNPAVAFDGKGVVVVHDDLSSTVVTYLATDGHVVVPPRPIGPRSRAVAAAAQGGVAWIAWSIPDGDEHQGGALRLRDGVPLDPAPVVVRRWIQPAGGLHLVAGTDGILLVTWALETSRHHAIPLRADGTVGAEVMLPSLGLGIQVAAAGDGYVVSRSGPAVYHFPKNDLVTLQFLAVDGTPTAAAAATPTGLEATISTGRPGATLFKVEQAITGDGEGTATLVRTEVAPDGTESPALPIDVVPFERIDSSTCEGGH